MNANVEKSEISNQKPENRVLISASALAAIHSHLGQAYPHEGCGVLIGHDSRPGTIVISRAIGTRNAEKARGADRFTIEPRDLMAIERELDARGDDTRIIGYFHSHPDAPARPSATDLEMARGLFGVARRFYVYAIVTVSSKGQGEFGFWRLRDDLNGFVELHWQINSA